MAYSTEYLKITITNLFQHATKKIKINVYLTYKQLTSLMQHLLMGIWLEA